MAKHLRLPGSIKAKSPANSYVDVAAAYMDVDGGGTFAQFGAKGPGSIGVKIRTVLAGVALTFMTATAAGAVTFAENVSMSPGKTLAAQAITATTITITSTLSGVTNGTGQNWSATSALNAGVIAANTTALTNTGLSSFGASATTKGAIRFVARTSDNSANTTVLDLDAQSSTAAFGSLSVSGVTTMRATTAFRVGTSSAGMNTDGTNLYLYGDNGAVWLLGSTVGGAQFQSVALSGITSISLNSNITQSGGTASLQAITGTTLTTTGLVNFPVITFGTTADPGGTVPNTMAAWTAAGQIFLLTHGPDTSTKGILNLSVGQSNNHAGALLQINGATGNVVFPTGQMNVPTTAGAGGTQGAFAWDANYLYICTATNTWRRVAHASW